MHSTILIHFWHLLIVTLVHSISIQMFFEKIRVPVYTFHSIQIPLFFFVGMVISYAEGAFMEWRMVAWLTIIYTVVPVIFIHIFVPERYITICG